MTWFYATVVERAERPALDKILSDVPFRSLFPDQETAARKIVLHGYGAHFHMMVFVDLDCQACVNTMEMKRVLQNGPGSIQLKADDLF